MARTLLIYGESGTYKTANGGQIADYIYETTGKLTYLASADSSWGPMADQIRRGIICPWNLKACTMPLPALMKASRGMWPQRFRDVEAGIMDEKVVMVSIDWSKVGAIIVEGLYMIAELLVNDLISKQRATGEPLSAVFTEDGVNFADTSRGTYKFVQRQTNMYVTNFSALPCRWVVFTGHEGKGRDTSGRMTMGPAVIGQAATDKVAQWFEMTLHHDSYQYTDPKTKAAKFGVRAYFERHPDADITNIFWPAKMSVEPMVKAQVYRLWSSGYVPLLLRENGEYESGVHTLLHVIEEAEGKLARELEVTA